MASSISTAFMQPPVANDRSSYNQCEGLGGGRQSGVATVTSEDSLSTSPLVSGSMMVQDHFSRITIPQAWLPNCRSTTNRPD
ncbi:hypothetical protein XACG115_2550003 [Xanthomonas citri pv. citri]|nr:hypothetical protein XACG115_2550003 [Xanthomonas citri pv. citri]